MDQLEERFKQIDGLMEVIGLFTLLIAVLMIVEFIWDKKWGKGRSWLETGTNIVIGIGNSLLDLTIIGAIFFIALYGVEQFSFMKISWSWQSWLLAIIAADLTYYWMHRLEHEIRLFWSFHSVHHSSPEFNLTTGMRLAWVESLFEWIFLIPMVLVGFDIVQTVGAFLVVVAYQSWIHTEKIGTLGWFDVWFNTPSPHRVHHGRNEKYLDKNYGGILLLWDHLFGTYQKEEEPSDYGLVHQLGTSNPFIINFYESWQIIKDAFSASKMMDALRYILGKPGWKPTQKD